MDFSSLPEQRYVKTVGGISVPLPAGMTEEQFKQREAAAAFKPTPLPTPVAPVAAPVVPPVASAPIQAIPEPTPISVQNEPAPVYQAPAPLKTTETTTSSVGVGPELRQAIADSSNAFAGQAQAITQSADRQVAFGNETIGQMEQANKYREEADEIKAKEAEKEAAASKAAMDKINGEVEKLDNQSYEGFWTKASTGQQIGAAIGIALAAVGQGLQRSDTNMALKTLEKAMDDDYRNYAAQVAKKERVIGQLRVSEEQRAKLSEQNLNSLLARPLAQFNKIQNKIGIIAERAKNQAVRDEALRISEQLKGQEATFRVNLMSQLAPRSSTVTKDVVPDKSKQTELAFKFGNEYQAATKDDMKRLDAFKQYRSIKGNDAKADETRLIWAMKMRDPNSQVTPDELKTSMLSSGIPGLVDIARGYVSGRPLSPENRARIDKTIEDQAKEFSGRIKDNRNHYEGLSKEYGVDPRISVGADPFAQFKKQTETPGAQPAQADKKPEGQPMRTFIDGKEYHKYPDGSIFDTRGKRMN